MSSSSRIATVTSDVYPTIAEAVRRASDMLMETLDENMRTVVCGTEMISHCANAVGDGYVCTIVYKASQAA